LLNPRGESSSHPLMSRRSKFHPEFPAIASRLRKLGMSAHEIAFALGIGTATYWRWRSPRQQPFAVRPQLAFRPEVPIQCLPRHAEILGELTDIRFPIAHGGLSQL